MPLHKLLFKPGVNVEQTPTLADGTYSASNLIRWRNGLPEKRGGWSALSNTPLNGVCRSLHPWADLTGNNYLAAGTSSNLELLWNGGLYDITPYRATALHALAILTNNGSTTVQVHHVAHGANAGDQVILDPLYAQGGVVVGGLYTIQSIIDANQYTITVPAAATATTGYNSGNTALFATVNTSNTVTVTLANHGFNVNDSFPVTVSTTVGGLTLQGYYTVLTVPDANTLTFAAPAAATSTTSVHENGNNISGYYLIPSGQSDLLPGYSWGSGSWGVGVWAASSGAGGQTFLRIWSLDNFGQNLVACPTGGPIYVWVPPMVPPLYNPATVIATAPSYNLGIFMTMPQEILMAFGSALNGAGYLDPLLIRWCDQADYTAWTPTATNQAGSFRLSRGSAIIGAVQAPSTALIWTDLDVWGVQYLAFPLVFGFNQLASNCGLIAQQAYAIDGNNVYWMSQKGFYGFTQGGVTPLPCSVWDIVYQNLNTVQLPKIIAAKNSLFNEILWFFPSSNSDEIDSYVSYNTVEQAWDYGSLERTAWTDQSVLGPPIGVDGNGIIVQHETAQDANGVAMTNVFIQSGFADIGDGNEFMFVDHLIPDFKWQGQSPQVSVTMYYLNWPGDTPTSQGPFVVTPTTEYITLRVRARQVAIKIEMDGAAMWFRLGACRLRVSPDGRV